MESNGADYAKEKFVSENRKKARLRGEPDISLKRILILSSIVRTLVGERLRSHVVRL